MQKVEWGEGFCILHSTFCIPALADIVIDLNAIGEYAHRLVKLFTRWAA